MLASSYIQLHTRTATDPSLENAVYSSYVEQVPCSSVSGCSP